MGSSRREAVVLAIATLYLASLCLPLGGSVGATYFLSALAFALFCPLLLLYWLANPLLWLGLVALGRGRCARAFGLGLTACVLAALPMATEPGVGLLYPHGERSATPWGYYAWVASMVELAAAGFIAEVIGQADNGLGQLGRPSKRDGLPGWD